MVQGLNALRLLAPCANQKIQSGFIYEFETIFKKSRMGLRVAQASLYIWEDPEKISNTSKFLAIDHRHRPCLVSLHFLRHEPFVTMRHLQHRFGICNRMRGPSGESLSRFTSLQHVSKSIAKPLTPATAVQANIGACIASQ